ncbi:MAG TPA: YebC/PmpR family DNA-binding transcriptional regulator [Nitrospirae bacterium]|nr:putative transcriptional regulatory protein [bacterium BMS3Abin06]HDH12125.1 YebC/PmpR family DNA-binding transcriptional regulator [Nitrospirota bacterium]HDZ02369.1 YebC/PmpR family DNA-binding transcriptional regulator [Nitrospirota bacterium]
MSGHSKWAGIKHKKAIVDAKRGKVFTKISKEISVAARIGGGAIEMNPRLRLAVEKAKEANMPSDNVKRAIQKGTGELPGSTYEESIYEGYGPGGVALLLEILTDNKNRTVGEIRHILSKHNGNLGEAGCVAWMFDKKGYILVNKKATDEDTLMSLALDAGAEDFKNEPDEENYEIITAPEDFNKVKEFLEQNNIPLNLAEITMIPQNYVKLESKDAEKMLKLMYALEEHDDVQNVYANFDIPDEVMAKTE